MRGICRPMRPSMTADRIMDDLLGQLSADGDNNHAGRVTERHAGIGHRMARKSWLFASRLRQEVLTDKDTQWYTNLHTCFFS